MTVYENCTQVLWKIGRPKSQTLPCCEEDPTNNVIEQNQRMEWLIELHFIAYVLRDAASEKSI